MIKKVASGPCPSGMVRAEGANPDAMFVGRHRDGMIYNLRKMQQKDKWRWEYFKHYDKYHCMSKDWMGLVEILLESHKDFDVRQCDTLDDLGKAITDLANTKPAHRKDTKK